MDSRIPQIVHYIWFGNGNKSELIETCMSKTKVLLKGWKIIEWDEASFDLNQCRYAMEAYENKKYAFASDYARFKLLYEYGGVYLDTDVELLKEIPVECMNNSGFCGVESNNKIAPGLIFACEPNNRVVKEIVEEYERDIFLLNEDKFNERTVVDRVTDIFEKYGFVKDGSFQIVNGFCIYPHDYFCAYDFVTQRFTITEHTISIHHYTGTWTSRRSKMKRHVKRVLLRLLGDNLFQVLISIKRKLLGVSGE